MKKTILALALGMSALAGSAFAADTYKLDPSHSYVGFEISHLGTSMMVGRFDTVSGEFAFDATDPAKSSVSVEVDVNSVNTNYVERDNHIRSAEILNAVGVGKATFKSESIKIVDEHNAEISGKLNILGADHDVVVKAKHVGGGDDPWGGYRQGFSGEAQLSLKALGVPMNLGPASDAVKLVVQLEGIRQ